jgi:hypothetical protein
MRQPGWDFCLHIGWEKWENGRKNSNMVGKISDMIGKIPTWSEKRWGGVHAGLFNQAMQT